MFCLVSSFLRLCDDSCVHPEFIIISACLQLEGRLRLHFTPPGCNGLQPVAYKVLQQSSLQQPLQESSLRGARFFLLVTCQILSWVETVSRDLGRRAQGRIRVFKPEDASTRYVARMCLGASFFRLCPVPIGTIMLWRFVWNPFVFRKPTVLDGVPFRRAWRRRASRNFSTRWTVFSPEWFC